MGCFLNWADMSALSKKLRLASGPDESKRIAYYCPGCKSAHILNIDGPSPSWTWDGNVDAPTLSPSIRSTVNFKPEDGGPMVCHHFLRAGIIEILGGLHARTQIIKS